MLHKVMDDLRGDDIVARDGKIGSVDDVYFDDERWAVRYLVVDTGNWLPGKHVLISPASVERGTPQDDAIRLVLSREQVENAPAADSDRPVSRKFEEAHARYYRYHNYWMGPYLWGAGAYPWPGTVAVRADEQAVRELKQAERQASESHLRSAHAVVGYHIEARDGAIGHVEDFIVDDGNWAIADMIVDTRNWLPGKKVLVAPSAVRDIDWQQKKVFLRLTRDEVERSQPAPGT